MYLHHIFLIQIVCYIICQIFLCNIFICHHIIIISNSQFTSYEKSNHGKRSVTPTITLDEIFHYLEKAKKPCFVSIDKFQVIAKYIEGDFEAN